MSFLLQNHTLHMPENEVSMCERVENEKESRKRCFCVATQKFGMRVNGEPQHLPPNDTGSSEP